MNSKTDRVTLDAICQVLAQIAPLRLAEDWDNVGLLVGDRSKSVAKIMTCLTVSPNVVDEAVQENVDLIVTHHPIPFKSLSRITCDTIPGSMLLRLITANVAIYSAHTAFDSASNGINQMWADQLGLQAVEPLVSLDATPSDGAGRCGRLATPIAFGDLVTERSRIGRCDRAAARRRSKRCRQQSCPCLRQRWKLLSGSETKRL